MEEGELLHTEKLVGDSRYRSPPTFQIISDGDLDQR